MAIGIIYCSIIGVSDIQTDKINMCGRNRDRYKMKTFYKVSDFNDRFDRITSYFLPFSFKNVVLFCLSWMGGQMGEQMEIKATLALFCLHRYSSSILSILYLYLVIFISSPCHCLFISEIRGRIVLSTSGHEKGWCLGWDMFTEALCHSRDPPARMP